MYDVMWFLKERRREGFLAFLFYKTLPSQFQSIF